LKVSGRFAGSRAHRNGANKLSFALFPKALVEPAEDWKKPKMIGLKMNPAEEGLSLMGSENRKPQAVESQSAI
jgi:hypothetical protein